jgi:hypothetical protein
LIEFSGSLIRNQQPQQRDTDIQLLYQSRNLSNKIQSKGKQS